MAKQAYSPYCGGRDVCLKPVCTSGEGWGTSFILSMLQQKCVIVYMYYVYDQVDLPRPTFVKQDSWTMLASRLFPTSMDVNSPKQTDLAAVVSGDVDMISTLVEIGVSPVDEYNTELLDNVHPAKWKDAEPDGVMNFWLAGDGLAASCTGLTVYEIAYPKCSQGRYLYLSWSTDWRYTTVHNVLCRVVLCWQVYNMVVIGGGTGGLVSAAGSAGLYAKASTPPTALHERCRLSYQQTSDQHIFPPSSEDLDLILTGRERARARYF